MRVAVNVEQLLYRSPGGIGRYSAQLAAGLPGAGVEVRPFTARHGRREVAGAMAGAGVTVAPTVLGLPRPLLYEAWHHGDGILGPGRLARALRSVDVVHAPSVATPPKERAALVVSVHDAAPLLHPEAFPPRGLRFHRMGLAAAARRADLVLTGSHVAAEEVTGQVGIGAERIKVVPYGVDPRPPSATEAAAVLARHGLSDRPYVLWVGSLEPRKDVGTLVAAVARIPPARRPALVLAGFAGWLAEGLIDPLDRRTLGTDLVEVGRVGEAELWALHGGATVTAVPSRHEGYGYPAVEAMASGVAVVVSDIAVLREVTEGAALTVTPGDVVAWASAIDGLLSDPAARRAMADAGRVVAARRSVAACMAATAAAYGDLVGATR